MYGSDVSFAGFILRVRKNCHYYKGVVSQNTKLFVIVQSHYWLNHNNHWSHTPSVFTIGFKKDVILKYM